MRNKEFQLISDHNSRPFLADASYIENGTPKPVIIFNHGFKGYKDWGTFPLVARYFASKGYVFIKMNFSHNGTTIDHPREFKDLEAFGNNNFSKELDDSGKLIDAVFHKEIPIPQNEIDLDKIYMIGHSRGGASIILKSNEDSRIKKIVTWAGVNDLQSFYNEDELKFWKENGTIYVENARTLQQMPLHYQLVENYWKNEDRLRVPKAIENLKIPYLIIHGTEDDTVPVESTAKSVEWNPNAALHIIEGGDHTFGGYEPYDHDELPSDFLSAVEITNHFFQNGKLPE